MSDELTENIIRPNMPSYLELQKENELLKKKLEKAIEQRDLQTQFHVGPEWNDEVENQIYLQNKELEEII